VGLLGLLGHRLHVLDVGGHNHAGDRPFALGDAKGPVDVVADGGRGVDLLAVRGRHVGVQLEERDLLLEVAAEGPHERLPHDGPSTVRR